MCWYQVEDGIYDDCVILGLFFGGGASPYSSCSTGSSRNTNSVEIFRNPFAPRVEKPIQTQLDNSNVMLVEQSGRNTEILKSVLSSDQNRS